MYKKLINVLHAMNIIFQAFYSLLFPVGVGALISYLLTEYTSVGKWIWAVLITLGVFIGLFSMVRFILTATARLERMESQNEERRAAEVKKAERQERLRTLGKTKKGEENGEENE